MPDALPKPDPARVSLVEELQRVFSTSKAPEDAPRTWSVMNDLMTRLETASPFAPSVHTRIATVRRWIAMLRDGADLTRFGGDANIREHIGRELRGLSAAVADYERAGQPDVDA